MLTLKQLKKDIQFNQELAGLSDILKGVASAQFRYLQGKREYFFRFNRSLEDFFKMVDMIKSRHPFLLSSKPGLEKAAIIMITSDEGFLGGLNTQVVNAGLNQRQSGDTLIVMGERGARLLEEHKESFLYFPGIPEEIEYTQAQSLRDYIAQQYLNKKFNKVIMVYSKFISFAVHEIKSEQLLPYSGISVSASERSRGGLNLPYSPSPEPRERRAGLNLPYKDSASTEILVEPSDSRIIDYLIRLWLMQRIYDIFWESKLSEFSSRVIHLEESSQVISELSKKMQFSYFRTLHQISDKNIREIIASRLIK